MPRIRPLLTVVIGLLLLAGVSLGWAVGRNGDDLPGAARIEVDASATVAQVRDVLGGVATENYFGPDDPVHPDWYDDYLGRTVGRIQELAPANGRKFAIRFGHSPTDGSWGKNGYHWFESFDPQRWATSIDEFLRYASLVNGEPYVAVNFGSGTAEEAADLVTYVNGTDPSNEFVRLRVEQGRTEPYQVRNWIVGFEQYGTWETGHLADREYDFANPNASNGGDPAWFGKPSSNPEYFAARAAEFARKMRDASPMPIRIYAPLNNWDLAYWGGAEESVGTIVPILGDVIDGLAIHFYPTNPAYGESDEDLLGRPDTLANKIDALRSLLVRYAPEGKVLDIGDVEFNNRSSTNGQTYGLVNGLFLTDTVRVLASKGVSSAFYFAISSARGSDSGFSFFEKGEVEAPMPTYLAAKLLARYLGSEVIRSRVSQVKMVTSPGGTTGQFTYPTLTALASLSVDRKVLYLVVTNKHLAYDQRARISLGGVTPSGSAQVTLLNGPSAQSRAGEVSLQESSISAAQSFSHIFPAHSVTGLRIPLSTPVGR